jgi:hypothetical protein
LGKPIIATPTFSDTDGESADERDAVRDGIDAEEEDVEGEDLFGPGIEGYGSFVTLERRAYSRSSSK